MLIPHLSNLPTRSQLTLEADFIKDLGLDSLDVVECVMAIEDEFSKRRALERRFSSRSYLTSPTPQTPPSAAFELTHAQAEKITCAKHLVHHIMH